MMIPTAILCLFFIHSSMAYLDPEESYPESNGVDYYYTEESPEDDIEVERRDRDKFLRFGRKSLECVDNSCSEDDILKPTTRALREKNDHYIRFGRSKQQDFLRFGRTDKHITPPPQRRTPTDFIRFGRRMPEDDHGRHKRETTATDEQNDDSPKRSGGSNFMRFGRNSNFMRFGRNMDSGHQQDWFDRMKLVQYNLMLLMNEIARHLRENDKKCNGN